MRSRVLLAILATGFVACTNADLGSNVINPLGTGGPSSVSITVGDSSTIPGFRPSLDTIATNDTVVWNVISGDLDAPYNITWDAAPPGGKLPANSGDLSAGQMYEAPALTTAGYYSYHCTHHKGMTGTLYVLMAVNNANQVEQQRRR